MDTHPFPAVDILVSIFMDDKQLAPLYREGLFESCITPSRFVRELRRLLKRFALRLKEESEEAVHIDIANFVASRAGLVAARIGSQCEQQRYKLGPASMQPQGMEVQNESHAQLNKDLKDMSSDDEDEEDNEPEGALDKNNAAIVLQGRSLIKGSAAFQKLLEELTNLVKLWKLDQGTDTKPTVEFPLSLQGFIDFIYFISLKTLRVELRRGPVGWDLKAAFRLEKSVPENHQRFRWMTVSISLHHIYLHLVNG